ncbi:hypothetical protein L0N33_20725, partial [Roseburia faecis]|nr:hypothetical protein [Roseburia faecis]
RDSGLAIIPAPRLLPRVIKLPEDVGGAGDNYVFLSSMIHAHADDLFQGMKVKGCYQFRLTRNDARTTRHAGHGPGLLHLRYRPPDRRYGS